MFCSGILCVIGICLLSGHAYGGKFDHCIPYDVIPEGNLTSPEYQNVDDLNDPKGRPWGYLQATIPYSSTSNENDRNPCYAVTLTNRLTQTVKFMATGVVSSGTIICVESDHPGSGATNAVCQSGISSCKTDPVGGETNVVKYSFSCRGCEEDTAIWLRFTVSPEITDNLQFEYWCADTNSKYPNDLVQIPRQPDKKKPKPTSQAGTVTVCVTLLFLTSTIHIAFPI